ncbi:MAG: alpha/beta hydrolase [Clostridia bacterium]|nr:alpha/beta hydrolase [Clostridia bacterium]
MFEQIGHSNSMNSAETGSYADIEFDTYITTGGKEEVQDISTRIHYYEAGQGEPLILIHGIGQSVYTWRNNINTLKDSFHVYALDLPGHGFSGKPEISYSVEEFALSIEAFMNAKTIIAANFIAFGEGAGYVLDFAMHNPERTKGIVLISPVLSSGGGGLLKGRSLNSAFGMLASRRAPTPQAVRAVLEDAYFDRTLVTDEVVGEYYAGMADRDFRAITRLSMMNFVDDGIIQNAYSLKNPVLVIIASDDKITGGRSSDFLRLHFGNGSLYDVRNCGYLVHEEKPKRVAEAVKRFLGGSQLRER